MANNQARTCELKCKYNVQGICHAYGECIAKDLFIAELEKMKEEFEKDTIYDRGRFKMLNRRSVLEIVDKHIAELKGDMQ